PEHGTIELCLATDRSTPGEQTFARPRESRESTALDWWILQKRPTVALRIVGRPKRCFAFTTRQRLASDDEHVVSSPEHRRRSQGRKGRRCNLPPCSRLGVERGSGAVGARRARVAAPDDHLRSGPRRRCSSPL